MNLYTFVMGEILDSSMSGGLCEFKVSEIKTITNLVTEKIEYKRGDRIT